MTLRIEIRDLYRSFSKGNEVINVLKGINLIIESGETVAIIGPSGSGKTTLSAKFAARIAQESDNRLVALGQLGVHKDLHMDSLKSFSRLINVPNINLNPDNVLQKLMDVEQKVVVDVCTDSTEAMRAI